MRLRYWLSDIFQDEATGAGEDSAAGTAAAAEDTSPSPVASSHEENKAFVEQWAAGRSGSEEEPITSTATATTTEPLKEIPVETTSTDAVSDDDAATKAREETGLDPLLLNLAEAYDYTLEDVKGFDNAGLKRLLAREKRLRGDAAPAADATKPENASAVATTPAVQPPASEAAAPTSVQWTDFQATLEEKLSEEGLGDEAIKREVKLAKARWDREEAILTDARQARSETEQMRQELQRQKAEYERKLEVNSLLDVADQFARDGLFVLGAPDAVWNEAQQAARMKYVQAYDVLKTMHPDVPLKKLAPMAMDIAFHEEIQKREAKSHARRVLKQANQVQGSGYPVKTLAKPDSPWDAPEIERQFQKMKRNAT